MVQYLKRVDDIVSFVPSQRRINEELVCAFCVNVAKFTHGRVNDEGGKHVHRHVTEYKHCLYVRNKEPYELFCAKCGDYCYSHFYDFLVDRRRPTNLSMRFPTLQPNLYKTLYF